MRKFKGKVVSNKMDKTAVVVVENFKVHPLYKKRFKVAKKFKVHDAENILQIGDEIEFVECRPLSRDKKWTLSQVINKA
jgi:small subunit ribosomal protein S17